MTSLTEELIRLLAEAEASRHDAQTPLTRNWFGGRAAGLADVLVLVAGGTAPGHLQAARDMLQRIVDNQTEGTHQ